LYAWTHAAIEEWEEMDRLGLLQQLDQMPNAAGRSPRARAR